MPDSPNQTPLQAAWVAFVESVQSLLGPQPDDRPLDQYLDFRDRVMALVRSEEFVSGLGQGVIEAAPADANVRVREALLAELKAFSRAAEVARVAQAEPQSTSWLTRLLPRAGTAIDSVKDLLGNLPPLVKSGLTLFKELIDMFQKSS